MIKELSSGTHFSEDWMKDHEWARENQEKLLEKEVYMKETNWELFKELTGINWNGDKIEEVIKIGQTSFDWVSKECTLSQVLKYWIINEFPTFYIFM